MGRIFREFSITIVVSIFASGIVSLTLTPLMCSRLLASAARMRRRPGWSASSAPRTSRARRVRPLLWFFLRIAGFPRVVWVHLPGRHRISVLRHSQVVPAGGRQFVHLAACWWRRRERRPTRCTHYQDQAEKIMQANPAVRQHLHDERQRGVPRERTRDCCWRS